jgi:hypothetical protein
MHGLGCASASVSTVSQFLDGYLAEVNFIDGQALTPSSFGETDATTGVWKPKAYTGTYGTNGFYLKFADNSGATATTIGKDSSGNGNNWTPNNISVTAGVTYDSMIDTPTPYITDGVYNVGNYSVCNSLITANTNMSNSIIDGNLNGTITSSGAGGSAILSSMVMTSGKYYWETTVLNLGSGPNIDAGILSTAYPNNTLGNYNGAIGGSPGGYAIYTYGGASYKVNNNTQTSYGSTYTTNDVLMFAFDATNGNLWFGKNGSWFASGDPALASNPSFSSISSGSYWAGFGNAAGASGRTVQAVQNFGQRPFTYTPPSGFKALNTQNLPTPTIAAGNAYMNILRYTGNGTTNGQTQTISGNTFTPDFMWIKSRSSGVEWHALADTVRGAGNVLASNATNAEYGGGVSSQTNGFQVTYYSGGNAVSQNTNNNTYVGWQWKANGSGSSNTSGSITSTVSANTTAGFSVVTYQIPTSGTSFTIGHGLGVAPSMIIQKTRSTTSNWQVYHSSLGATNGIWLNLTNASGAQSWWNNTAPTSTLFSINNSLQGASAVDTVAYCFAAVAGYSAFGSYTGNGSADGPFVFTGFRPRYVMFKRTDTTAAWFIEDSARGTYNVMGPELYANASDAESTASRLDFLSNGFKMRAANAGDNASGGTYIYAAFAENPLKYSLAR